jgi:hypothetical protein
MLASILLALISRTILVICGFRGRVIFRPVAVGAAGLLALAWAMTVIAGRPQMIRKQITRTMIARCKFTLDWTSE